MRNIIFGLAPLLGLFVVQACGSSDGSTPGNTLDASVNVDAGSTVDGSPSALAPTKLDLACGGAGRALFPVGIGKSSDRGRDIHRLADGRTLLIGTVDEPTSTASIQSAFFASLQLKADCSLDTGYGSAGLTYFPASNPDYQVEDIQRTVFQADGSTLVFGTSLQPVTGLSSSMAALTVAKFTAAGMKDTAFGTPFVHLYEQPGAPFPADFTIEQVEAQPDGSFRILASSGNAFALLAFANGAFDTSKTKILTADTAIPKYEASRVEGMHVNADGSMLIGGAFTRTDDGTSHIPGVLKLKADGTVDATFGTLGVTGTGTAGSTGSRTFLAVQPDGKILLASVVTIPDRYESFGVTRFNAAGNVDLTFGIGGVARVDVAQKATTLNNVHELEAFVLNPDGSMLLGGQLYGLDGASGSPDASFRIGVARLLSTGALDTSFDEDGVFDGLATAGGKVERLNGLEQDANGTISVIGTHVNDNSTDDSDWVTYRFTRQP